MSPPAKALELTTLPNVEHILIDATDRQHVVLRTSNGTLQMMIEGAHVATARVNLCLSISSMSDLVGSARLLRRLEQALSPHDTALASTRPWSAQSKRLRDALLAVDARRAGVTFRQVASLIYGRERVARDWPGAGLKVRVRRDLHRGLALCGGGYRDLLGQG
jgi:hypothetical protein